MSRPLRAFGVLGGAAVLFLGCVHGMARKPGKPGHHHPGGETTHAAFRVEECGSIKGFTRFDFPPRSHDAKPVYQYGEGPGVLILHEIDGLTPETLCLARAVAADGYSVFLPLFFGDPGQQAGGRLTQLRRRTGVCLSHDFCCICKDRSSPIVGWLRDLVPEIEKRSPGEGIGVIGMCMTGSFPLALMDNPAVKVVVLSQPSLPLPLTPGLKSSLGLSQEEIRCAQKRSGEVEMLAFRFANDMISPPEKFETLEELFRDRILPKTFQDEGRRNAHAVLTSSFVGEALDLVLEKFRSKLKP